MPSEIFKMRVGLGVVIIAALFLSRAAQAYHHFIGYGYSSCLTCHTNGAGSGSLNDYGRALFSAEIASRALFPASLTDESLAQKSQFLPGVDTPFWLKPSLKYRALSLETNPGSEGKSKRWIPMQKEFHLDSAFSEEQKVVLALSLIWNDRPRTFSSGPENEKKDTAVRDAFVRYQLQDDRWIYLGQMEKVFGLREINHTALSRKWTGLGQFDQSLGFIFHQNRDSIESFVGFFTGNIDEAKEQKFQGVSAQVEFEPREKWRLGFSGLSQKNQSRNKTALALHQRLGLGKGSALSAEFGFVEDRLESQGERTQSVYLTTQSFIRLFRGYHFLGEMEWGKADVLKSSPDFWRWSLGFLTFPFPRFEYRLAAVNTRTFSESTASGETWAIGHQLHFSF